jgi:hypothetical protein
LVCRERPPPRNRLERDGQKAAGANRLRVIGANV